MIPRDILMKLDAVIRRIEIAAAFDGIDCQDFNQATSIKKLAEISGMSERSLRDYFKLHKGCKIVDYASKRRAEYAARIFRLFPNVNHSRCARVLGFTTRTGLYNLMRKNGVFKLSSLRNPTIISGETLTYRIEKKSKLHLLFKLDEVEYNECNSPDFETSSWDKIENYVKGKWPDARLDSYIGFAIDRYIEDNPNAGIFVSGILYENDMNMKLPNDIIGEIGSLKIPAQTYAIFTHKGSYDSLNLFYQDIIATLSQATDIEINLQFPFMEKYINSPSDTVDEELITEVLVAITSPTRYNA